VEAGSGVVSGGGVQTSEGGTVRELNPFAFMSAAVIENDGALCDRAFQPEGRLCLHTIEGAFAHVGLLMRDMTSDLRRRVEAGEIEKPVNMKSKIYLAMWLKLEESWIMSDDESAPFSFMWCCNWVAHDPEGFASALRKAFWRWREDGTYQAAAKRLSGLEYNKRRAA